MNDLLWAAQEKAAQNHQEWEKTGGVFLDLRILELAGELQERTLGGGMVTRVSGQTEGCPIPGSSCGSDRLPIGAQSPLAGSLLPMQLLNQLLEAG
ncbi:hypothetical protein scyTo_0000855 [Scyliorhinus torazame]|uniref:Uncharacterized protein n=1 Tax=Scyliorhinus torazame TaxID=75743 RepID=A0A401P5F2_SCYTO|nr:hypothetical protein [Scyliorhinus torazame]